VADAGRGFDAAIAGSHGFGLTSMRERVEGVGGSFAIDSRCGRGTVIDVLVPLAEPTSTHAAVPLVDVVATVVPARSRRLRPLQTGMWR
jgi:signal transduction histidine kinase